MGKIRKILTSIIILGIPILCTNTAHGASYVAQYVGAAVNNKWVRVSTGGPVAIDIVPTAAGTLGVSKGSISVETNSDTGYRLYISGANSEPNGYMALYHNGDSSDTAKFTSVTSEPSSPAALSNGQWGWALPTDAVSTFPVVSDYSEVAKDGSVTDPAKISNLKFAGVKQNYGFVKSTNTPNENNPDSLDIYYGAVANHSMLNGSYYNVVVYTAFVEGNDAISVSPNAIQDGGIMTISTNIQGNASPITTSQIEMSLYNPADRSKNIGTCDNIQIIKDGTVDNPLEFSCTYHIGADAERSIPYGVQIKIDPKNNGIYLSYTMEDSWKYGKPLDQITYMQDVTTADCAVTPTWDDSNITYTLVDNRETPNKSYLVRKLADNNCWMSQNLALQGNTTISWENSDLPEGTTYTLPDGAGNAGKFSSNTVEDMYNGTHKDAANDNISDNKGAYYNWNVMSAGLDTEGKKSYGETSKSICPKGWRLASAYNNEYDTLSNAYSNDLDIISEAWALSRSGYYSNGYLNELGSCAFVYSGSIASVKYGYFLLACDTNGNVNPKHFDSRSLGLPLRCRVK